MYECVSAVRECEVKVASIIKAREGEGKNEKVKEEGE